MSGHTLGVTVLGSGSSGNSLAVHSAQSTVLIDAGFSNKQLCQRLKDCNLPPEQVKALLITHEHSDHVKGARVFADKFDIPTYGTAETVRFLRSNNRIGARQLVFEPGTTFSVDGFSIEPFAVQHDAMRPVGFVVRYGNFKIGVATDLGHLNRLAQQRLTDCDVLVLECNHDPNLQMNSQRPLHLKRRVLSRHGHLSNQEAVDSFDVLLTPRTKYLFLAHISGECNNVNLVEELALNKLTKMNRTDIVLSLCSQAEPSPTAWL